MNRSGAGVLLSFWLAASVSHAMVGEPAYVAFTVVSRGAALVRDGVAAPLCVDEKDHSAVLRAARDTQADIERVTGVQPELHTLPSGLPRREAAWPQSASPAGRGNTALTSAWRPDAGRECGGHTVVIAGTLGRSRAIDDLVAQRKLDVRAIAGKWESFLIEVIERPMPGVDRAIVIAGSDRRGTVYGLYDLSEQIGVSPWYWWADVPVKRHDALYVKPGRTVRGEPAVKYRGIFINDEAPAMQNWAREKFGGFNHELYGHVFELILRLRGNYIWPAMWGNAFVDDDPGNAALAEEYGIVLGTSHHEPMMRAHDEWRRYGTGEWDYSVNAERLREFWRTGVEHVRGNEKIVTVGMRGDGDQAMSAQTNVALLEGIVADQRAILEKLTERPAAETPQLWALYKEVQQYYERGMRVPDDVTLLWCDDNWGNIRRLPLPAERQRAGGAGVYYHLEYVGGPRNYKWINTVPIAKVWEQMNLAWQYGATRIWIVNVGDIKPSEFPAEFFLTMAWDPSRWTLGSDLHQVRTKRQTSVGVGVGKGAGEAVRSSLTTSAARSLDDYSLAWATREFGPRHAADVAVLINGYAKLNSRRKPEMLAPDTFSLVNYDEAERVLAEWSTLVARAERVYAELPEDQRAAFFQLVLYPVKASAGVQEIYIATGRNRMYALQGRASANEPAVRARELFAADGELVKTYHRLNGGKWNHMMSQAKLGYTSWQQPDVEVAPALSEVHPRAVASMAIAVEGNETAFPSRLSGTARLPPLDPVTRGPRRVEVFNRGTEQFSYTAKSPQPWIVLAPASGTVSDTATLSVNADWTAAPTGDSLATIQIEASTGEKQTVELPLSKPGVLPPRTFNGFIESDRHIAIEALHFSRAINSRDITWRVFPDFGRTLAGVTTFPVTADSSSPVAPATTQSLKSSALSSSAPRLEYDVWLFSTGDIHVELQVAPSLDFQSGEGLRLAASFDDAPPQILRLDTMATQQNWDTAVADGIRRVFSTYAINSPGHHVLKLWRITSGVILERIIIDAGGVRRSYLGPPESIEGSWGAARPQP